MEGACSGATDCWHRRGSDGPSFGAPLTLGTYLLCHTPASPPGALGTRHLPARVAGPPETLTGEDRAFLLGLVPLGPRRGENAIVVPGDGKVSTGSFCHDDVWRRRGGQLRGGRADAGREQGAWRRAGGRRGEKRGASGTQGEMPPPAALPEPGRMSPAQGELALTTGIMIKIL